VSAAVCEGKSFDFWVSAPLSSRRAVCRTEEKLFLELAELAGLAVEGKPTAPSGVGVEICEATSFMSMRRYVVVDSNRMFRREGIQAPCHNQIMEIG
jgi:hypothetical protein